MFGVRRKKIKCYEEAALRYEAQPLEKGKILFYGHSLFTRWGETHNHRPLEADIRKKDGSSAAINHGIGGSIAEDLLYYYNRLVKPYEPSVLVLATGANDIRFGYSAWEIMNNLARVIDYARADFPEIPVYCFTFFPAPKHDGENSTYTRVRDEFNEFLEAYCQRKPGCTCVHLENFPMFFENSEDVGGYNNVRTDIFVEDGVHFNQDGYDLFGECMRQLLEPHLR